MIKNDIERDLSKYGQRNPCPMSLTVIDALNNKLWRHYELGAIMGFVIYNCYDNETGEYDRFQIASIGEDDEHWFFRKDNMDMNASWVDAVDETWRRVVRWKKKHLRIGWPIGSPLTAENWISEVKEPIVEECIPFPHEAHNAVLGTRYAYIDENNESNADLAGNVAMEFTLEGTTRCTYEEIFEACEVIADQKDDDLREWLSTLVLQSNSMEVMERVFKKYEELVQKKKERDEFNS